MSNDGTMNCATFSTGHKFNSNEVGVGVELAKLEINVEIRLNLIGSFTNKTSSTDYCSLCTCVIEQQIINLLHLGRQRI